MGKKLSIFNALKSEILLITKNHFNYYYFVLIGQMIVASLIPLIGVVFPKVLIQIMGGDGNSDDKIKTVLVAALIVAGCLIILTLLTSIFSYINNVIPFRIRMAEFAKSSEYQMNYDYEKLEDSLFLDRSEQALEALANNAQGLEGCYHKFFRLLPNIFLLLIYLVLLSLLNPIILVFVIISMIVIFIFDYYSTNFHLNTIQKYYSFERKGSYFLSLTMDYRFGKNIRISGFLDGLNKKDRTVNREFLKFNFKRDNVLAFFDLPHFLIIAALEVVVYYLAIKMFIDNKIGIADLSLYLLLLTSFSLTLKEALSNVSALRYDLSSVATYNQFMKENKDSIQEVGLSALPLSETFEVEFKDVSFHYPKSETNVLNNLNLKIKKGEKLAIVGVNGAGKTTIVKLLLRLFVPTSGSILINSLDIKEFNKIEYWKQFSVVFQDYHLLSGTLLENVIGDSEDADKSARDRGIEALYRAGLKEKIESLKNGVDTVMTKYIENDGVELSGGQIQKIALARALYKNGYMIILDEPTAALDPLAEAQIYEDFNSLINSKTAIFISHRLSSTQFCDKIAFFDHNSLTEYGTHEELMKLKGSYYEMFKVQGKYYQEDKEEII